MNILYLNRRDEQKRLLDVKAYITDKPGSQDFTDTYSYMFAREQLKAGGIPMGLDCSNSEFTAYLRRNGFNSRDCLDLKLELLK